MTQTAYHLVWFRDDLRTDDHPALFQAMEQARQDGKPVLAIYIYDPALWGDGAEGRALGGASQWWLHHSLDHLATSLAALKVPLVLRRGPCLAVWKDVLSGLPGDSSEQTLWFMPGQTPFLRRVELRVRDGLAQCGVQVRAVGSSLWVEPDLLRTGAGKPYRVFTPFWKSLSGRLLDDPQDARPCSVPDPLPLESAAKAPPQSDPLHSWGFLPSAPDWATGFREHWQPGEDGALELLAAFLDGTVTDYAMQRDMPAVEGTSRLSAHLRFGEISPRRIWHAAMALHGSSASAFLREVGWREFNHHLLFQFPAMAQKPLQDAYASFPWLDDRHAFKRWTQGMTGFPLVDAGMRQLWQTGWMHNRVRMMTGSFLVKDLLLPWQWGEQWMWDTLVDACPANNPGNWQWVAGCGADAAPYFRIFNPTTQAEKFDPTGDYRRQWIAEWKADQGQKTSGFDLFTAASRYPLPMVDHGKARERALAALAMMKEGGGVRGDPDGGL